MNPFVKAWRCLSQGWGLLFCLFFLSVSNLHGQSIPPIAYWQFEAPSPGLDVGGFNHHLLHDSLIATSMVDALAGSYWNVNDTNGAFPAIPVTVATDVTLDDSAGLREQMTWEFWYRPKKNDHKGQLFWGNKGSFTIGNNGVIFSVTTEVGQPQSLVVNFNGIGVLDLNHVFDGNWHHYVMHFDIKTGEQRMWIDGISGPEMVQYHGSTSLIGDGGYLVFSEGNNTGVRQMYGHYDEIAIYDTIVPRELIRLHYLQALDSGMHYTFVVPPTDPTDFPFPITETGINVLEFGEDYPNVPHTEQDLLYGYPDPRYQYGRQMERLVPWLTDPGNSATFGHGSSPLQQNQNMRTTLEWLAREYNYYLYGGILHETMAILQAGNLTNQIEAFHYLEMLNDPLNADLPRFMISNWGPNQASFLDASRDPSAYIVNDNLPDDFYIQTINGQPAPLALGGKRPNFSMADPTLTNDWRLDSVRFDGQVVELILDSIFNRLDPAHRWLDMFGENDETMRQLSFFEIDPDSGCRNDYANNLAGTLGPWATGALGPAIYQGARTEKIRQTYTSPFRQYVNQSNGLLGKDSLQLTWYDLDGLHFYYDSTRAVLRNRDGFLRGTPHYYPQLPSRTLYTIQSFFGFDKLVKASLKQQSAGDSLFNPAVSPGYNDQFTTVTDVEMVRPGQFLGVLKALGALGADTYSFFMYHGNNSPRIDKHRVWKPVMLSYAQAVTSRASEFWYHGQVLVGDTAADPSDPEVTWFTFNTQCPMDLIVGREEYGTNRYLLSGAIQRSTNMPSSGPKSKDVCIAFRDAQDSIVLDSLAFEIRLQGSTYVLELDAQDTFFMQLDGWHEWSDPWRWCRDFNFEAEVTDTVFGNWSHATERPLAEFPGDFRNYTSYLSLDAIGAGSRYYFQPRFHEQNVLFGWVRARATAGNGSLSLNLDGGPAQTINGIGTAWDWYPVPNFYGPLGTSEHFIEVMALTAGVEIDQIALKRTSQPWPSIPLVANVELDSIHLNQTICYGDSVYFSNFSSVGQGCYYHSWEFGDGTRSNDFEPVHRYAYPGTYQVIYTLAERCLDIELKDTLTVVVTAPTVDAGPDQFGCALDTLFLNGMANGPFAWQSDPVLSDTSILNPFVNTDTSGYFYLTASDSATGCQLTDSVRISLVQLPPTVTDTVCILLGDSIMLNPGGAGPGLIWTGPAVIAGDTNRTPIVAPVVSTYYVYDTWDACNCDTLTDSILVAVRAADLINSWDQVICEGDTAALIANPSLANFIWSGPNLLPGNSLPTVFATPTTTSNYVVQVNDPLGCILRDTATVLVNERPTLIVPDSLNLCLGDSLQLNVSGSGSFTWNPAAVVSPTSGMSPLLFPTFDTDIFLTNTVLYQPGFCAWQDTIHVDVDSTCCVPPGIVDYALYGESAANFSQNIAGCNPCAQLDLYIRDTFWVDTTLTLTGTTLWMDSAAVIWVLPGQSLTLDSCTVQAACGSMWDGLYLDGATAHLTAHASSFFNAEQAIVSLDNGDFQVDGCVFEHNRVGIWVQDNGGLAHPGQVSGSRFFTKPQSMLPPYAAQYGDAGIYLDQVGAFEMTPLDQNQFVKLACGVLSDHSNLRLGNAHFEEIQSQAVSSGLLLDASGKAVYCKGEIADSNGPNFRLVAGGNSFAAGNQFVKVPWGVHVVGNHTVDLQYNQFSEVSSHGVMVERCFEDSITLARNHFTDAVRGIRCAVNTRSTILIDQNQVNNALAYAGEAIKVQDMNVLGIPIPGNTVIQRNSVDTYGHGIVGDGLFRLEISRNTVYIRGEDPSHGYGVGISTGASDSCHILDNNVRFVQDPNAPVGFNADLVGIWIYQSNLSSVSCNRTYNFHDHHRVTDTDTDTMQIFKNGYYDGLVTAGARQRGIVLKDGSNIGQQGGPGFPTGNRWYRLDAGTGFYTESWICNSAGTRAMVMTDNTNLSSSFEEYYPQADPIQDPDDPQQPNCNAFLNGSGFHITITKGKVPAACNEFNWGDGEPGEAGLQRIAQGAEGNPDEAGAFIAGQSLLSIIKLGSLPVYNDDDLEACYQNLCQLGQGEVYAVDLDLLGGGSQLPGLASGPAPLFHHQTLEGHWRSLALGISLPAIDSLWLDALAQGCPLQDGKAVHQARSLMGVIAPENIYSDQACEPESNGKSQASGTGGKGKILFEVVPNPATNHLQVVTSLPDAEVKVTALSGKVITTFLVSGQSHALEVAAWPRGVYLFFLTFPDGQQAVKKVVLQ